MDQHAYPNLPPMPPPSRPMGDMPPSAPFQSSPPPPQAPRTARLRQALTAVAGGGFLMMLGVGVGEVTLPPNLKPTTWLAIMEAQTDLGIMNQKLGQTPGTVKFTEAEYRTKLAEAERSGQAKAEIGFQRELAGIQATKERMVQAYGALYQRTNIIAQAGVQMEAQALQFRQRLIEQTNGGRAAVISVLDGLCAFGDANSCQKAKDARAGMIDESTTLTTGDLARKVNELMAGIPDPATLVAQADRGRNGTPALP